MIAFWILINRLLLLLIVYDIIKYSLHVPVWVILVIAAALPQFLGYQGNYLQALLSSLLFVGVFFLIFW